VPLQNRSSWPPSDAPCDRFSELGTRRTSAFHPRGRRPRSSPLPRPRPTAGGYSSRSKPARVGMSRSSRSRRASAPRRFSTSHRGHPAPDRAPEVPRDVRVLASGEHDLLNTRGSYACRRLDLGPWSRAARQTAPQARVLGRWLRARLSSLDRADSRPLARFRHGAGATTKETAARMAKRSRWPPKPPPGKARPSKVPQAPLKTAARDYCLAWKAGACARLARDAATFRTD
jgi:hypothetical protein